MTKWLESLDDCLLKCLGVNKCTLARIARSEVAVKPHAMDTAVDYENVHQETRGNMERNSKKIAHYWLFFARILLASEVEKRAKQHVYPQALR